MSALEENKLGTERVSRLVGVHGIDNGLIPIVAYNYGVSNKSGDESAAKRVSDAVKWALIFSVLFYLVFFGVLELAPGAVLGIFDASDHMLRIGTPALRVMALAWLASIPALVMSAGLQGLSMGMSSMVVTMARQAFRWRYSSGKGDTEKDCGSRWREIRFGAGRRLCPDFMGDARTFRDFTQRGLLTF